MTKRTFQERFYNHISYVRSKKLDERSGKHFTKEGHTLDDMQGVILEKVHSKNPATLKIREQYYIDHFDTFRKGLNRE